MKKRADIKIGYQCNNKCKFCVQGNKREHLPNKSTKEVKRSIRQARKTCEDMVFTGGEATLREDFLELVRYAKELSYRNIQIQTNGRMFAYEKFCKEVIAAGATEFSPAVHGHKAEIHDYLTDSKGSFDQTIKGIKNLKQLKQRVLTNTVVTAHNYEYLPEVAKLLIELGVDQYQFAFVHITGTAWENKDWIVPRLKKAMKYIKKGLDIGIKARKSVMTEAIPYCLMKGYEQYIAEKIIPSSMVIEYKKTIKSYEKYRAEEGKTKRDKCEDCRYFSACEGPWREYPDMFGWTEFIPVKKKK
ncbi:radical SAM protein [Candidatus Margulisiibacteriota bacterium]